MWIVKYGDNTRHSAWDTYFEAIEQANVLKNYGHIGKNENIDNFIEFDSTVQCENGHYYV